MANVLLIHPPTDFQKNYRTSWLPYSVLSLGSHLQSLGHYVNIIDGHKKDLSNLCIDNADLIGISSMIGNQLKHAVQIARTIKSKSDVPIVLGGPFPTLAEEVALQAQEFDYLIRSQGEKPLEKLLDALLKKGELNSVPSLSTRHLRTELIMPLSRDAFGRYNFNLLNVKDYIQIEPHIADRTINYIASQGCVFNCAFCSDTNIYSGKWVTQEVQKTVDDITMLIKQHNINGIKFYDSNFFMNSTQALVFASQLIEKEFKISWGGAIHPLTMLQYSDEDMGVLKQSGLKRVLIGLESPNEQVLQLVGKGKKLSKEDLTNVVRRCKKYDISGSYTMIVGFPDVPGEHVRETIEFGKWIKDFDPNSEVKIHIYYPYPNTRMYARAISSGFVPHESLDYYMNIDYYESKTPFSTPKMEKEVREFNLEHSLSVKPSQNMNF